MTHRFRFVSLLAIGAFVVASCGGAAATTAAPVATTAPTSAPAAPTAPPTVAPTELPGLKLGEISPLTGGGAGFGESQHNGILMAVDEINASGGIPGIGQIILITEDSASDPTGAVNAANKLINQDKVSVILGELLSGNTLAVVPITQRAGIPQLAALSSAPTITQQGSEFIFRTQITAARSAAALAQYFNDTPEINKVAIINDTNEFGTNYANVVESTLKDLGNPVVARETYVTGDTDFTSQLLKIQAAGATGLVISGHFAETALILQQIDNLGLKLRAGGPDATADPHIFDLVAGELLEGYIFTNSYARSLPDPLVQEYVTKFEARFQKPSGNGDAVPYDTVYIIADAAARAGSVEPQAIRDALVTSDYTGLTGRITFDETGDAQRGPYVLQYHADHSIDILVKP